MEGQPEKKQAPQAKRLKIRAADAKEVGVGNPAEETFRHPNLVRNYQTWPPSARGQSNRREPLYLCSFCLNLELQDVRHESCQPYDIAC
jgi:hypothetical protein